MRVPGPFPLALRDGPFTVADARAAGVSRSRLRSADVARLRHGVYRWIGAGTTTAGGSVRPPADRRGGLSAVEVAELRALAATCPDLVVTGATAARWRGWPEVPGTRAGAHDTLRPRTGKRPAGDGHRTRRHPPQAVRTVWDPELGLRFTTVEETWFQLARTLPVDDLVVLGDFLVRTHRPRGAPPWRRTSPARLAACLERHRGRHGIRRAREALALVRDGADSPPETELRLALRRAGLPEPTLQVEVWDAEYSLEIPATGDIAFPEAKVVLQYEGAHHDGATQVERDTRRDAAFQRAGWLVVRVSRSDRRQGFRGAVALVRRALAERTP